MPRAPRIDSSTYPYHVTARCNTRADFPLDLPSTWEVFNDSCLAISWFYSSRIHAFVLMPNHFHLIMTTPVHPLGNVMEFFMRETAREINRRAGRRGHVFGGPYDAPVILTTHYFVHAMKYVYRNPVAGGLCTRAEDYEYSTFGGRLGSSRLRIPIQPSVFQSEFGNFEREPIGHLEWLNLAYSAKEAAAVRGGLHNYGMVAPTKDRASRRFRDPRSGPLTHEIDAVPLPKGTA